MSYIIFGRAIKTEYLTLATLFTTGATAYLATRGAAAGAPQTMAERVDAAVPVRASSREEEALMDSIKNYVAEAEKEGGGSSRH